MSVLCWCREVMKNKWYFWGICTFLAYLFLGQLLTFTPYIVTQILIISDALSNQNVALLTSSERDSTNQISSWGVYEQFRPILLILRFHFYTVSTFQSLYLLTFTPMRTLNKYYFSLFFPTSICSSTSLKNVCGFSTSGFYLLTPFQEFNLLLS